MIALFSLFFSFTVLANSNFSGELAVENRYFREEGLKESVQNYLSFAASVEYSYSWDNDRKVFSFLPFIRQTDNDEERNHFDIRELSYVGSWDSWEFRAGISKVYWGVVESFHLVDIINQVDWLENLDGEDRLGQLMINPTYVSDYGNLSLFILPHFRIREFTAEDGRLRLPFQVNKTPVYESSKEDQHIDFAVRWSHYIDELDWALSFFKGTSREPMFQISQLGVLTPLYFQIERVSVEGQYVFDETILKNEMIFENSDIRKDYVASVTGLEYTISNIGGGKDIGLLAEYLFDSRDEQTTSLFWNHLFLGTRIAWNDEKGTELLLGGFVELDHQKLTSLRLETKRRINNNWKWELEGQVFINDTNSSILSALSNDDYIQMNLSYYF